MMRCRGLSILVALISLLSSSHLTAHHEPFEKSIADTEKMLSKLTEKSKKNLPKILSSKKKCEKYYEQGEKNLFDKPNAIYMQPSRAGNYPNSSSIMAVGGWATSLGKIRLEGCPDGSDITMDLELARQFFEMAVIQYSEEAMYRLGLMLINGEGGERDTQKGLAWISMAAAEWNLDAVAYLKENELPIPGKVEHQTKALIINSTHGDNVVQSNGSRFWELVGVLSVFAIGAYATYKATPSSAHSPSYAVQQSLLPAILSVSNASAITTLCPDNTYHPDGICRTCPDGSYTTAPQCSITPGGSFRGDYGNGFVITPKGNWIPNTGSQVFCPDGQTYAGNWCHLNPDGTYIGINR